MVWASIYVLVLGRSSVRRSSLRGTSRSVWSAGRPSDPVPALPWPVRTEETDEVIDLTVEQTSRPRACAQEQGIVRSKRHSAVTAPIDRLPGRRRTRVASTRRQAVAARRVPQVAARVIVLVLIVGRTSDT
jgi:hypothetical protein